MLFLISSTGHGWREIQDEWDVPRAERWIEYCNKQPPLRAMVAAYLGFDKPEPFRVTEENFHEFMAMVTMDGQLKPH